MLTLVPSFSKYLSTLVVGRFMVSQKFLYHFNKWEDSMAFIAFTNSLSWINFLIWDLSNTPVFSFSSLSAGKAFHMYMKHGPSLSRTFTNCFINSNFMCNRESYMFTTLCEPTWRELRLGQFFFFQIQCWSLARLSHKHKKHVYLCQLLTQPKWRKRMIQSLVLNKLAFNENKWVICVDLKMVNFLLGHHSEYTKLTIFKWTHMTHLCSLNVNLSRTNDWIILFLHFCWVTNRQRYILVPIKQ